MYLKELNLSGKMLRFVSNYILHNSIKKIVKYLVFRKVLLCSAYNLGFTSPLMRKVNGNETG